MLKEMISYYQSFKGYFYSQDECYKKYFCDMWEHCYNSRNSDFEYITPYENELNTLLKNYDSLKDFEIRKSEHSKGLETKLWTLITQNIGILQKDIYKEFDDSVKSDIQYLLYNWDKSGKIKREKSGGTYKIIL
ncbi:MAG: hypothetical protein QM793_06575 [Muricomes sp.]